MNTIAVDNTLLPRPFARPRFARLITVELRKSLDTRSGFWLVAATLVLTCVAAVTRVLTGAIEFHDFLSVLELSLLPMSALVPVIGALLVTAEWSQRTALTTFTHEPHRLRVIGAKIAAGITLGSGFLLFAVMTSAIAVAALGDAPDRWAFGWTMWGQYVLHVWIGMLMGLALGAMTLASAPAIVTYFAAPTVTTILVEIKPLASTLKWIDPGTTISPLTSAPFSSADFQHLASATLIWVVLPMAIGLWRIARAQID